MIKKIFIVVLLFFLCGEIIRFDFGNAIILKPVDVAVGLVTITYFTSKFLGKQKIIQKYYLYPILFFAGLGLLSLLINSAKLSINQFFVSLMYLIRWTTYAGIFFVVNDFDKKFKEKIQNLLIVAGSLIIFFGYIQFFYYSTLRNLFYLGWDEHMYRMFSVFLDPNFAGAFFVLFFLFLINLFFKNKNILIGGISLFTLGAVFLTFSRSALIMLVMGVCTQLILLKKKKMIFILLAIVFIVLLITSRYFNIENINLFRAASTEARLETAKNALSIFAKNPLIGVGFNTYRYMQFKYGFRNEISISSHADASPDNSFLFVLATTGILGFSIFALLWYRILKRTLTVSPLFVASAFGILIDSFFINSLFYPFTMLWLWMVLALSIKNHN
jgi:O-antigen ligase